LGRRGRRTENGITGREQRKTLVCALLRSYRRNKSKLGGKAVKVIHRSPKEREKKQKVHRRRRANREPVYRNKPVPRQQQKRDGFQKKQRYLIAPLGRYYGTPNANTYIEKKNKGENVGGKRKNPSKSKSR